MTEVSLLEGAILAYLLSAPIIGLMFVMHGSMEAKRDELLYFGRKRGEKGIVSICRWTAIFVVAPFILIVAVGIHSAKGVPGLAEWLTEEP